MIKHLYPPLPLFRYMLNAKGGCSLVWKGGQGFAFLNLDMRQHPDLEVIAQRLSGITLKDVELNVQTDQVV